MLTVVEVTHVVLDDAEAGRGRAASDLTAHVTHMCLSSVPCLRHTVSQRSSSCDLQRS